MTKARTVEGVTTPATKKDTPRQAAAKSKPGRAHAHVPKSRWADPKAKKATKALPPLDYSRGPYTLVVPGYAWRLWAIRGDNTRALMREVESFSWDDASSLLTGSITFHTPDWMKSLNLKEGHKVQADYSTDGGRSYTPCWTMRLTQPTSDLVSRTRSLSLVSDLNRLGQSIDNFTFVSGKKSLHPGGWRVDQIIEFICNRYKISVRCPKMRARATNWHIKDQAPLDVIHTALLREKHETGNRYAVRVDAKEQMWVTSFQRPRHLYLVGRQLIAATGSTQLDPRFATKLTVRSSFESRTKPDKKGHRKVKHGKVAVDVSSKAGIKLYGLIHRNVYSPDAKSTTKARKEGKLFLYEIAKPKRAYTVTLTGLAFIKRLDAFKVVLPEDNISQIVYVSEAHHTVDATSGYTTEVALDFEDPFGFDKNKYILTKLSDVATARARVPIPKPPKPKKDDPHKSKKGKPKAQTVEGVTTPAVTRK